MPGYREQKLDWNQPESEVDTVVDTKAPDGQKDPHSRAIVNDSNVDSIVNWITARAAAV